VVRAAFQAGITPGGPEAGGRRLGVCRGGIDPGLWLPWTGLFGRRRGCGGRGPRQAVWRCRHGPGELEELSFFSPLLLCRFGAGNSLALALTQLGELERPDNTE